MHLFEQKFKKYIKEDTDFQDALDELEANDTVIEIPSDDRTEEEKKEAEKKAEEEDKELDWTISHAEQFIIENFTLAATSEISIEEYHNRLNNLYDNWGKKIHDHYGLMAYNIYISALDSFVDALEKAARDKFE